MNILSSPLEKSATRQGRVQATVKLPARERGASGETPSETPPKPPGFALRATPWSPLASPPRDPGEGE